MRTFVVITLALIAHATSGFAAPRDIFETRPDGSTRALVSGFVFPARIGAFQRDGVMPGNTTGSKVWANYACPCFDGDALVKAEVYVYPAPREVSAGSVASEYASIRNKFLREQESHRAAIVSERSITIFQDGKKRVGRRGKFSYEEVSFFSRDFVTFQLLLFRDDFFFVSYSFNYPRDHAEKAEREIEHFVRAWSWRAPPAHGRRAR